MTAPPTTWARLTLAVAAPIAVSAAWMPIRDRLPNTDLALLLVIVTGVVGWSAGPGASLVSAVIAAVAFDLLDTRPYGTLTISRAADVVTAGVLLATGVLAGVVAARLAGYRKSDSHRSDALAVVMQASGLVATGEEQRLIIEALGAELVRALDLVDCEFQIRPPTGTRPSVSRDGSLVGLVSGETGQIDLPIWRQGDVVAHYRLTLGTRTPSREELRVALSLADQAGAAMAGPAEPPPPGPTSQLRLLRSVSSTEPGPPAAAQPREPRPSDVNPPRQKRSAQASRRRGAVTSP